jgi:dipeptidyl aminopeptidase/acylaminoacyl peptidase
MYLLDVETKEQTHVATEPWANQLNPSWSHDSRWLTFHMGDPDNTMGVVHLYDVENAELTPITSNFFDSNSPTFDRKGDFLYFASSRNFSPEYSSIDTTFVYNDSEVLIAVPLREDVENPWALESDEVEWDEEETEDEEDGDEEGDGSSDGEDGEDAGNGDDASEDAEDDPFAGFDTEHPLWGVWEGEIKGLGAIGAPDPADYRVTFIVREDGSLIEVSEFMGETDTDENGTFDVDSGKYAATNTENGVTVTSEATLSGDTLTGTWEMSGLMELSGTWTLTKTDGEITEDLIAEHGEGDGDEAAEVVEIDLENIEARAMKINVEPGNFGLLQVNDKNQLLYMRYGGGGLPSIKLYDIDKDDDGEKNVMGGVMGFGISADGKKMARARSGSRSSPTPGAATATSSTSRTSTASTGTRSTTATTRCSTTRPPARTSPTSSGR